MSVAQASGDLDFHATVLRRWIKQYGNASGDAFAGKMQTTSADDEGRRLRREVAKLKAERDILKIDRIRTNFLRSDRTYGARRV